MRDARRRCLALLAFEAMVAAGLASRREPSAASAELGLAVPIEVILSPALVGHKTEGWRV
jgi:hypothetical protein